MKVAVVSGSNKGIGFEIVKGLYERFNGVVYLTARDENRGLEAVKRLNNLGVEPRFHVLDVADYKSVEVFRDHIAKEHGYIDLIINNAAIASGIYSNTFEEIKNVMNINYYGLLNMAELLYPLVKENGRIVNVSSDCGHLSNVRNTYWINRLSDKNITVADVNEYVEAYLDSVKNGTFNKEDYADNSIIAPYRVSKVGVCALTVVHQKTLLGRNISVNSCHPGYVKTDMTQLYGFYSAEEGAGVPLYLALDAPQELKGSYVWHDKTVVDWYDYNSNYYFVFKNLLKCQ